ncbi:hypothetical protein FACS189492_0530 [Clostridia bacterium]|nr:hypothetical protein FACS189492_0530 [Clostridia bacterium]
MNKIISFIITFALIASSVPSVFAVGEVAEDAYVNKYAREFAVVSGLKLMEIEKGETFDGSIEVSRHEAASIAARMLGITEFELGEQQVFDDVSGSEIHASSIAVLKQLSVAAGYGDGKFNPNDTISYQEFVKLIVEVLGYNDAAMLSGAYPVGYLTQASRLGVLKGVSAKLGEPITRDLAAILVYNSLEVKIQPYRVSGSQVISSGSRDGTIMSKYLHVYKSRGIVSGTSDTLLTGASVLRDNETLIGKVIFYKEDTDVDSFLGYNVSYYYKDDDRDEHGTLLYIEPLASNEVLEIASYNIAGFDERIYSYFDAARSGRQSKAKVSRLASIIYNGKRASGVFDRYASFSGNVTLIDNNGDGEYDVVLIVDYKLYHVLSVSVKEGMIYDKNNSANILDLGDGVKYKIIDKGGKIIALSEVAQDDILLVAVSEDGELVTGLISSETIIGEITELSDTDSGNEKSIYIDGELYYVNELYRAFLNAEVGDFGSFYLDFNGRVAGFKKNATAGVKAGYVINAAVENGLDGRLMLKTLTTESRIDVLYGTSKMKLERNGEIITNSSRKTLAPTEVIGYLSESGAVKPQIVLYTLNSKGEINSLKIAMPYTANLSVKLKGLQQTLVESTVKYEPAFKSFQGEIVLSDNALVFSIPKDIDDYNEYSVADKSVLRRGEDLTVAAYKTSEDSLYSDIVVGTDLAGLYAVDNEKIMLVDKVAMAVNESGEECYRVYGMREGQYVSYTTMDRKMFDDWGIAQGDIINVGVDSRGLMRGVRLRFDESARNIYISNVTGSSPQANPSYPSYDIVIRYLYGSVYDRIDNLIGVHKITGSNPDIYSATRGTLETIDFSKIKYVYIFDRNSSDRQNVSEGTIGDIRDYKTFGDDCSTVVFALTDYGRIGVIVIYK